MGDILWFSITVIASAWEGGGLFMFIELLNHSEAAYEPAIPEKL